MKTNHALLVKTTFLLCFIALTGCQTAPKETAAATDPTGRPDLAKIRAEIQALEIELGDATTNNDLDALLEYYADDAISLANDAPMLVGKAAIGDYYKKDVMGRGNTHAYQTIDVFSIGAMVLETGKSTRTDAEGKASTGKYMALYEKRNGYYVCIREMYNNDQPSH